MALEYRLEVSQAADTLWDVSLKVRTNGRKWIPLEGKLLNTSKTRGLLSAFLFEYAHKILLHSGTSAAMAAEGYSRDL